MMEEISLILYRWLTPVLFAVLIFFIRRFISQNDEDRKAFDNLRLSVAEIRVRLETYSEQLDGFELKLDKALVMHIDVASLKTEVKTLRARDDVLYKDIQEIRNRYKM